MGFFEAGGTLYYAGGILAILVVIVLLVVIVMVLRSVVPNTTMMMTTMMMTITMTKKPLLQPLDLQDRHQLSVERKIGCLTTESMKTTLNGAKPGWQLVVSRRGF